jgi:phosphoribosylformimino-5-aminoimidazole carboxamide ribonucleotide (ProFAR) isomerase
MLIFPEMILHGEKTAQGGDPLELAHRYRDAGVTWLYLTGEGGQTPNYVAAKRLIDSSGLRVMIAGGINTREAAEKYLSCCVGYIVLDLATVTGKPLLLEELVRDYPERVAVEFDARDVDTAVFVQKMRSAGVRTLLVADRKYGCLTDAVGTLAYRDIRVIGLNFIARVGVSTIEQLHSLKDNGVYGVVLSSAALEGPLDLAECVRAIQPATDAYGSVEQRMAYTYLETFPPFVAATDAPVSEAAQRQFYDFMRSVYQLAYDEPGLLVNSLHPDGTYLNPFQAGNTGRPGLKQEMDAFVKRMDDLLKFLFASGGGEVTRGHVPKTDKAFKAFFERLGITGSASEFAAAYPAWLWLCTRPGANWVTFAACVFDEAYPYARDVWASLLGGEAFKRIETVLLERGYTRITGCDDASAPQELVNLPLPLKYANLAWDATPPSAAQFLGTRHTGLVSYYARGCQVRAMMALQIPNEAKIGLQFAADAPPAARELILERIKRCDGCGYCNQTDRKRPRAFIPTTWDGNTYLFCPYFPAFNCCWVQLDDAAADKILSYLGWLDTFVLPRLREKKTQKKKA